MQKKKEVSQMKLERALKIETSYVDGHQNPIFSTRPFYANLDSIHQSF